MNVKASSRIKNCSHFWFYRRPSPPPCSGVLDFSLLFVLGLRMSSDFLQGKVLRVSDKKSSILRKKGGKNPDRPGVLSVDRHVETIPFVLVVTFSSITIFQAFRFHGPRWHSHFLSLALFHEIFH